MSRALVIAAAVAGTAAPTPSLRPVTLGALRVTEGAVLPLGDALGIEAPKVRAVLQAGGAPSAELRFTFLGPTAEIARLDDGEARQQLGLKLRARDACNVLYVMWRVEPQSVLAVQVKRNLGQSRSAECGARGYRKLPVAVPLPHLVPGESHALRADLDGDRLRVRVDGAVVWEGAVGGELADGPVGLRTDNVRLRFQLAAVTP